MRSTQKLLNLLRTARKLSTIAGANTTYSRKTWRWVATVAGGSSLLVLYSQTRNKVLAASSIVDNKNWMAESITSPEDLEKNADSMRVKMEMMIMDIQRDFCRALEAEEGGKKFQVDKWQRKEGGGGITCVLQDGEVFEKAGVNISVVMGNLPPPAIKEMKSRGHDIAVGDGSNLSFFATGISSVIHPKNPFVPTVHFNYRYFEIIDAEGKKHSWFGGGTDLTPYFLDEQDVKHFHSTLKAACDPHDKAYYPRFKKWCDNYFFIKHRDESRGVGGIFFDDLDDKGPQTDFKFVCSCAASVVPSYLPIVKKNKNKGYSLSDRQWQLLRRGRYVEFNLVYDRGTKFGLYTPGARIESILMSLPLTARWEYCHEPKQGTNEAKLMDILKNPKEWV